MFIKYIYLYTASYRTLNVDIVVRPSIKSCEIIRTVNLQKSCDDDRELYLMLVRDESLQAEVPVRDADDQYSEFSSRLARLP